MKTRELLYALIKNNLSVIYENEKISSETDLIKDLSFDSITIIQLILDIEETFDIEINDEIEYEELVLVGKLEKLIIDKLKKRA